MGFFHWIPDESDQVVSPYIAIWMGITIFSTVATWWRFKEFAKQHKFDATHIYAQLDNDPNLISLSGPSKHVASDVVWGFSSRWECRLLLGDCDWLRRFKHFVNDYLAPQLRHHSSLNLFERLRRHDNELEMMIQFIINALLLPNWREPFMKREINKI